MEWRFGDDIAMLPMLFDVFAKLPNWSSLHITDKLLMWIWSGSMNETILISYITEWLSCEIFEHIAQYTLPVQYCNPAYLENQCNFPSKIIEALLHKPYSD